MKQELIGPTAAITAAILARFEPKRTQLPNEVIASAFQQAHEALVMGIARVDAEAKRPPMTISQQALNEASKR